MDSPGWNAIVCRRGAVRFKIGGEFRPRKILRNRDFQVPGGSGDHVHRLAERFDQARLVGGVLRGARQRAFQQLPPERLGGLNGDQRGPVERLPDDAVRHLLDRVRHRDRGDHGVVHPRRDDGPEHQVGVHQRPGGRRGSGPSSLRQGAPRGRSPPSRAGAHRRRRGSSHRARCRPLLARRRRDEGSRRNAFAECSISGRRRVPRALWACRTVRRCPPRPGSHRTSPRRGGYHPRHARRHRLRPPTVWVRIDLSFSGASPCPRAPV